MTRTVVDFGADVPPAPVAVTVSLYDTGAVPLLAGAQAVLLARPDEHETAAGRPLMAGRLVKRHDVA